MAGMSRRGLSFSQEALWFLSQLQPESPFYNVSRGYRLRGPLDRGALERAFADVVGRHAILRSRVVETDGRPELVVDPPPSWPVDTVDLSGSPAELPAAHLEQSRRPFDVARDLPVRAQLIHLGETEHVLDVTFHHLVADRWSVDEVFGPELAARYAAHVDGDPAPMPALAGQYWDFAAWERGSLTEERRTELLAYWRHTLVGAPAVLDVPGDRPRPAEQSFRGAVLPFTLPAALVAGAQNLSRAARTTLFTTILTAYAATVAGAAGTDDVIVGVPAMNPGRSLYPDLVGMFVNTLPIRLDLRGDLSARAALTRARTAMLDGITHRELPFDQIVDELDLDRDLSRNPLIQVVFQFAGEPPEARFPAGSVFAETVAVDEDSTRFDLEMHAWLAPDGGIAGKVAYATDRYDEATVAALLRRMEAVLGAMVADPDGALATPPTVAPQPLVRLKEQRTSLALPARTSAERLVLDVWQDVLGVTGLNAGDNFFHVGGSSLRATRVAARLRRELGADVPLRLLFEHRTAAALAAALPGAAPAADDDLTGTARPDSPPLSFAQERLWFLDKLVPGSTAYIIDVGLWLKGDLDRDALERAFTELVRRHEILRTSLPAEEDGRAWQAIAPPARVELPVVDVVPEPDEDVQEAVIRAARERIRGGFPLEAPPLWRATLFRAEPERHALVVNVHHAIFDGVSIGLMVRELAALYTEFTGGPAASLPDLPVQFADYAGWQRRQVADGRFASDLDYWRRHLAGVTPLELPTDRPRPPMQSLAGGRHEFSFPEDLTAAVRDLDDTPYVVLLAAYSALLGRHGDQDDVCVATAVDNRSRPELEQLVGFFADTLVMRIDLSDDPSFRELLGRARDTFLAAHEHRNVPFERLVDDLDVPHDASRNPLAQVSLVFHDEPLAAFDLGPVRAEPFSLSDPSTRSDLELHVRIEDDRLHGMLAYATDLFDPDTAVRLTRQLETLLAGAVAEPDRPLSELDLLDAAARHELLVTRNDTAVDLGPPATLHGLVEEQVRRTPDAPAVVSEDGVLSYAELDARANRLAAGIGAGPLVAVYLERSPELVVALLAVLKAGAAFLPLSPDDPRERTVALLRDAGPAQIVTATPLRDKVPDDIPVVLVEDAGHDPAHARLVEPRRAAYVLPTSGSTGTPNGAVNTHAGIVNMLRWTQSECPLGADDAMLQRTPVTFDVCLQEIFWALMAGARLVLPRPGGHRDPAYLLRLIREHRVTTLQMVPSLLRSLLREPTVRADCASLRWILCGGEALDAALLRLCRQLVDAEVYNMYGPAEAAVTATAWRCAPGPVPDVVPIGRPIGNTQAYVLDARRRLVPIGVPGELYLGGVGVGLGYHGRDSLTDERFVPDPFGYGRLFRTGDRVRHRSDGTLEYLGRLDDQVKLRGVRIEPGEIEAALGANAGVRAAAVALRRDDPDRPQLVAYVVAQDDVATGRLGIDLTRYLRNRLPLHMVPTGFVILDELPLSRNGKLDRRRLPAPADSEVERDAVPPRDDVERTLVGLFEELLRVSPVGVTDDFFALGGHSIVAAQLMSRVEQKFVRRPPLGEFFEDPTVAGLAGIVRTGGDPNAPSDGIIVRLRAGADGIPPLLLFSPVGGGVRSYRGMIEKLRPGSAIYGVRAPGLDVGTVPESDLHRLALRHAEAIQRLPFATPYRMVGWSFGGIVTMGVATELAREGLPMRPPVLIDTYPNMPPTSMAERAASFVEVLTGERGIQPAPEAEDEPWEWILGEVRTLGLGKDEETREQLGRYWAVYKANLMGYERYRPMRYPGSIVLLRPSRPGRPELGPYNGWDEFVDGDVIVRTIPGDHYAMAAPAGARAVAEFLDEPWP